MKLRDLSKANYQNDGTRSLLESIMIPEVDKAFRDWCAENKDTKFVLLGGVALSFYVKPRNTTDADLLFLFPEDIPLYVEKFKRHRPGAFLHKQTNIEIEVLTPASINLPQEVAQAIFDTAKIENGIRIASPSGLVASKLGRFKLQDQADIDALLDFGGIDLAPFPLPPEWLEKFNSLVANRD